MCLAIPGRIVDITDKSPLTRSGRVSFGGVTKSVNLSTVPDAVVGDYVLVHAGLAISTVNPDEAAKTIDYLSKLESSLADGKGGP